MKKTKGSTDSMYFDSRYIGKILSILVSFIEGKEFGYVEGVLMEDVNIETEQESFYKNSFIKALCVDRSGAQIFQAWNNGEDHDNDFNEKVKSHEALVLNRCNPGEVTFQRKKIKGIKRYFEMPLSLSRLSKNYEKIEPPTDDYFSYVYGFLEGFSRYYQENKGITYERLLVYLKEFIKDNTDLVMERRCQVLDKCQNPLNQVKYNQEIIETLTRKLEL